MPTFEKMKRTEFELVEKVMKKYHGELQEADVRIDVLLASPTTNSKGETSGPPLKRLGYPVPALIKVVALPERAAGLGDALFKIDAAQWAQMSDKQKAALVDYCLTRLELKKDSDGVTKTDDLSRPLLQIKCHDREVNWYDSVVKRHERDAYEWTSFDAIANTLAQMQLPFMRAVG